MYRSCLRLACVLALGASSLGWLACDGGEATPDASVPDAPPPEGTLRLNWTLQYADATLACRDVGALSVTVVAVPAIGGFGVPSVLGCDEGTGATVPMRAGVYHLTIGLVASGNAQLVEPLARRDVTVVAGQESVVGAIAFDVVPAGTLELVIENAENIPSCAAEVDGGAGMTAMKVEVRNTQGECVPVELHIEAGATQPAGLYDADCAGAVYGCIERDQRIRIPGVPSGTASMVITGYKGEVACFRRAPQFTVTGGGLTTELLPQRLVRDLTDPACEP